MSYFKYKNNVLHCEDIPLDSLAQKYGTPLYVTSYGFLQNQFRIFDGAFSKVNHLICYSMKANSSRAVLSAFIKEGSGIDVVSGGELLRALAAGCDPQKIVFSGVGKSEDEIRLAIEKNILQFNVEGVEELQVIDRVAQSLNKKAPIAIRVNPDVDPKTHAYISTGMKKAKFGVSRERSYQLYRDARKMAGIEIVGIDCHIGSQLTQLDPIGEAVRRVMEMVHDLEKEGIAFKNIDLGGGLGIVYKDETPPTPEQYAQTILKAVGSDQYRLIFEPGRFLVGNSAALVTKVMYNKDRDNKKFVIVDAALNDLMRPAMYDSYHEILPVAQARSEKVVMDVVGPICESGDFFAHEREMPRVQPGEFLSIMSAGAYGFSMASNYNSRGRAAEVMVNGSKDYLVNEREKLEDLIKGERVPDFLL